MLSVAFYGTIVVAMFVFVQAVVRIGNTFAEISRTLEEIALALRSRKQF